MRGHCAVQLGIAGSFRASRACLYAALLAAWLARPGQADTYDIGIKLYSDNQCMFWADDLLLLDGGCYANIYSNNTKAFSPRIVYFNEPQRIDFREYTDDCYNLAAPKRTFVAGRCTFFAGVYFAEMTIRNRGSTCSGPQCSPLAIVVQTFYSQAGCTGPSYALYRFPVQNECMRWANGTQTFATTAGDQNVTLVDYVNDTCRGVNRSYTILNQYCYVLSPLQAPRSVMWRVQRDKPYAGFANAASRLRPASSLLALAAFLLVTAVTAAVPQGL